MLLSSEVYLIVICKKGCIVNFIYLKFSISAILLQGELIKGYDYQRGIRLDQFQPSKTTQTRGWRKTNREPAKSKKTSLDIFKSPKERNDYLHLIKISSTNELTVIKKNGKTFN